jgi:hypothetical protein
MTDLEIIPQHEPEVIAAGARKYFGDDEKVATTSMDLLIVRGVKITSRYKKAHEFELMRAMILALRLEQCRAVQSIFCDSKAGSCFSVVLRPRPWNEGAARAIGRRLEEVAMTYGGGHNGITVSADDGDASNIFGSLHQLVHFDPDWGECE